MTAKRQFLLFAAVFGIISGIFSTNDTIAAEVFCPDSYYGVGAHITFGDPLMPQKLAKMREAGIRGVRTDFLWGGVEPNPGEWHFESLDRTLDEAEKNGVAVFPVLLYSAPWAKPAVDHLDEWCNYVKTTVTRYKNRVRTWEIWNEENLEGFWTRKPSGEEYTKLLKASYETIKAVDPDFTVIFGGLAGVPLDYIEEAFKAGAGNYFDVMNIHPYRVGFFSTAAGDQLLEDIAAVRNLMEKYHCSDKPVWITEMGWATLPGACDGFAAFMKTLLNYLRGEKTTLKAAYINDPNYPDAFAGGLIPALLALPDTIERLPITVDKIKDISPESYDVLIMPPGESFPAPYFADMRAFVENGGTLVLTGGVPFYYEVNPGEDGKWIRNKQETPDDFRQEMRIGWRGYWFDSVPESVTELHPTEILCKSADSPESIEEAFRKAHAIRYLSPSRLAEGDEMIPLAIAPYNDTELSTIVLYRYHDWKGQIVVSTVWQWADGNTSNEADQAAYLVQSMLLARCGGISKYFWYEFQSSEADQRDKESFFGITHADLSPKPAYFAYQTLTAAAPEGAKDFCRRPNGCGIEIISWTNPDGKKAWAVWAPGNILNVPLKISGTIDQAFNLFGEPVDASLSGNVLTQKWTPAVRYFIGPENITPVQ